MSNYDQFFFDYNSNSSAYSAHKITSLLVSDFNVSSVLDVGCATGTWLSQWGLHDIRNIHGVDGDYVNRKRLEIDPHLFTPADLNRPFDLGRQFDLVQSLEVAEHVYQSSSDCFVGNLARHAQRMILFSAAPPGQGGENHINEQTFEFWRTHFHKRGFVVLDYIRPAIAGDKRVSYWYRFNTFLYVRRECVTDLPLELASSLVSEHKKLVDISPFLFRIRKRLVRMLPRKIQNQLARVKSRFLPTGRI